jgi:transcriptional regulator with XRE-family HTH domain
LGLKHMVNNRSTKLSLGEKIVELRKEKGWSQDELAEKIEGGGRQISKYENNKTMPSVEVIIKLAEIFNISADYLLFDGIPKIPLKFKYQELLYKIKSLEDITIEDNKALVTIIDAIIARNKLKKIVETS